MPSATPLLFWVSFAIDESVTMVSAKFKTYDSSKVLGFSVESFGINLGLSNC
jgi:hypothetical protein